MGSALEMDNIEPYHRRVWWLLYPAGHPHRASMMGQDPRVVGGQKPDGGALAKNSRSQVLRCVFMATSREAPAFARNWNNKPI